MEGESQGKDDTENSYLNELISSLITDPENKAFDNYFGGGDTIEMLKSFIVLPFKFPQLYKGSRAPFFNSFMLFGAPGCGKTHLVYATAKAAGVKLFVFHAWDLQNRLYGGGEKAEQCMKTLFEVIKSNSPCIVCFEDLEVLSREETHFKKGRTAFLTEMRSLSQTEGTVIMAMTLAPWKVDAEVRQQFRHLHICLPDQTARVQMLHSLLNCSTHDLKSGDFEEIADRTQGFTGSDMHCLIQSAKMKHIKMVMEATHFKKVEVQDASSKIPGSTNSSEVAASDTQPKEVDQYENQGPAFPPYNHCSEQQVEARRTAEKLIACKPEDEGAIPMTLDDIPEDKLFFEYDITMNFIRQALHGSRPTMSDEEISRFKQFESEFCV